ncbi:hypothetical protein GCM10022251_20720 [Phytohabitans flavus]|uniref:Uncharacterized protein n=1 Tax=Phytohabitans flavus TaxID=1076124 RepID=A0A6F8XZL8_9ACTN|nr:hypothetical protein [Phytohabitans flavus]BCB79260.1 hypothetical protein Pflav_056700 [Phytohabitans flavus]
MTTPALRRPAAALPLLLALFVTLLVPPPGARPAPPRSTVAGSGVATSGQFAATSAWPSAFAVVAAIGSAAAASPAPGAVAVAAVETLPPPAAGWSVPRHSTVERAAGAPLLAFRGRAPPA